MDRVKEAVLLATTSHHGQKDKAGQAYITHPLAVMLEVQREFTEQPDRIPEGMTLEDLLCAAVLHDVVEDTPVTLDKIEARFGKVVRDIVDGVTRREGEVYIDFILRAKKHPGARIIKVADLLHNMSRISNLPKEEQGIIHRYQKAERILNDVE
jgi:GTP diphosphokinase / guanosine-3',5'-bis(diphosphate) 3'-diphosphatase